MKNLFYLQINQIQKYFLWNYKTQSRKKIVELCKKSNLKYTIIRSPLVYGPNIKGNFGLILKAQN